MPGAQVWGAICVNGSTFRLSRLFKFIRFYCLEINLFISKLSTSSFELLPVLLQTHCWTLKSDQDWNKCELPSIDVCSCSNINKC